MSELKREDMYGYQEEATKFILGRNGSMLWMDMGLGKSIVSLTAIEELLDSYKISAALVMAPLKVVEAVWKQEAAKWEHTSRLKFSAVTGTPKQRLAALKRPAEVYLINYEQIQWLVGRKATAKKEAAVGVLYEHWIDQGKRLPFDMVVFDEISKMKNSTAKRARGFAKILPQFTYRVGLTGTPAGNGFMDLHGQFLMVDGGHRLGPNITSYRNRWFYHDPFQEKWVLRRGATQEIQTAIQDMTLEMSSADYISLPPLVNQDIEIILPKKLQKQYKQFEKEFFMELDNGEGVEAFNAGAKSMKCRQLANGAVYVGEESGGPWEEFHALKTDALEDVVDGLGGKPLLVCYQFKHDAARIKDRFPEAVFIDNKDTLDKVEKWNRGEIQIMCGHPESMGHGLNLQFGGNHVLWFGLPWSLELYLQAIARLLRNGQKGEAVINHRLTAKGTIESAIAAALETKTKTQADLRTAIRDYRGLVN